MNTYRKQISCINQIAKHFAMLNYHVTTTFYSHDHGCEATIFFHNLQLRESIERDLSNYVDSDDSVLFQVFDADGSGNKFYTLKIQKYPI